MRVLVSACLLGENCKYNGKNNYSQKVIDFVKGHEVIAVCPEALGGLSTPRIPSEIVNGLVINANNEVVDSEFKKGAERALKQALDYDVDLAILQSRSPSCGVNEIYDGSFSGKLIKGQGVLTKLLIENGIRVIDVENL